MVEKLIEAPHTRRAQAITWMPFMDNDVYDPPCLQSIWCRLSSSEEERGGSSVHRLNINIRIRSNDAWGAAFMNMFGLTHFIRVAIANPIEEGIGEPVKLGRMNWQADSYHVYGKNIEDFENRLIKRYNPFTLEDRVWNLNDPEIQDAWNEATEKVKQKIAKFDEDHIE
jgi:thymidylate synthase